MRGACLGLALIVGCSFRASNGASDAPPGTSDAPRGDAPGTVIDAPAGMIDARPDAPEPPDWWDTHWAKRIQVRVLNAGVTAELDRFPVLVTLTGSDFEYGASTGSDLRFVSDDGSDTVYASEIDTFVPNGTSQIWVLVPVIAAEPAAPTTFWMYFDNPAPAPSLVAQNVWIDYVSVHHLSGSADASGHGHTGSAPSGGTLPTETAGLVGSAAQFDGNKVAMQLPNEGDFDLASLTVSMWIKTPAFTSQWQCMVCKGDNEWRVQRDDTNHVGDFGTNNNQNTAGNTTIDDNNWHYVVATFAGSAAHKTLYVDGVADGSDTVNQLTGSGAPVEIGANSDDQGTRNFGGIADEVRITAQVRSAAWIKTEYQMIAGAAGLGSAQPIVLLGGAVDL